MKTELSSNSLLFRCRRNTSSFMRTIIDKWNKLPGRKTFRRMVINEILKNRFQAISLRSQKINYNIKHIFIRYINNIHRNELFILFGKIVGEGGGARDGTLLERKFQRTLFFTLFTSSLLISHSHSPIHSR